jgi:hypothetical protein
VHPPDVLDEIAREGERAEHDDARDDPGAQRDANSVRPRAGRVADDGVSRFILRAGQGYIPLR